MYAHAKVESSCNIRPEYSTLKYVGEGGAEGLVHSLGHDDHTISFCTMSAKFGGCVVGGRRETSDTYHSANCQFRFEREDMALTRDDQYSQMTLIG